MRLAGYQPHYFPRLHYFNRILNSDIFEISDYVQFVQKHAFPQKDGLLKRGKSFQAHSPIKLDQGIFFLTVPVHDKLLPINKTEVDYSHDWAKKQLKSIEVGYRKSLNFSKFYPELEEILNMKYKSIGDLNLRSLLWGIIRLSTDEKIEINKISVKLVEEILAKNSPFRLRKIFLASQSPVPPPQKGKTNEWIINLCKFAGADEYYYGNTSGAAYMNTEDFKKAGIKNIVQDWICQNYSQQYPKAGFVPNLSVIDLVMNEDIKRRQEIII